MPAVFWFVERWGRRSMAEVAAATAPTEEPAQALTDRRHQRNLLSLSGGQLLTWSFVLVWTLVVPRRLGPSGWGMLVTASALGGILGVLMGYGTRNYLVREMVRTPRGTERLLGTALTLRLALFLPGLALLVVSLRLLGFSRQQSVVIFLGSAVVYLLLLAEPLQAVFQAVERMEFLAASNITDKVGQAAGAIVLVLLGFGVVAVSVWWLVATAILLALNLLWARRFTPLTLRTNPKRIREMVVESFPYWSMGLFLTFYVWIDTAMLAVMTSDTVVGWYGVPTRLFGTLLFAATIISTAWLPRLVTAHQLGDEHLRAVSRGPAGQLLVLGFPIAFGAAVVADPLIRGLYGRAFSGAVPVMIILALCVLPLYVNIMANEVLVASGRQAIWTRVMIGASVVNPLLNLAAIPLCQARFGNGAIGAALSLLATELMIAMVSLFVIMRGVFDRGSLVRVVRALLAALGMTAVVYSVRHLGLIAQVFAGVACFSALAVLLRVPTETELSAGRATLRRLRPRRWSSR
jgi:O-antigen/teichoic acid export membrane protein